MPVAIEEELWFGGNDQAKAEDAAAKSVAALVGRIVGAKPFPESARRLATLTRKDVVRIEPIIQVLERDPALSARLLRLVNSAGYALRQRCTSVRHAATLVGTDRLHQIATTAAVLDLFDSRSSSAARIIEHSTIVGAFCRYFGAHLALPVDDLFTAGFLHDIGKLMLLETEGVQYVALLDKYANEPDVFHVVERSLYGFDHAVLAAHVLNEWNIPDPVPKIVAWHHDPTRAYKSSSMMAALVQTVRLADAAVYAMIRSASQEEFSSLAAAESASYLDISEPQLASMWEELQTLYRESVEQCRGENAPALDPRSMRPKQPLTVEPPRDTPRSTELPLQFPCVVCNSPTFGNTCSACGGHMCPEHQVGREGWCTICARDFHSEEMEATAAMSPRWAMFIGSATVLVSIAIGYQTGGFSGGLRAGVGTSLLIVLALVLMVLGGRLLLRFRFIRSRPNRTIDEALENDGGVKSLVPPTPDAPAVQTAPQRDPVSEHVRLSGALVEHVKIQDFPAIPQIIGQRALDEMGYPAAFTAPSTFADDGLELPKTADKRRPVDAARERAQSQSLVTLPAPSHDHRDHHDDYDTHEPHDEPPSGFGLPTPSAVQTTAQSVPVGLGATMPAPIGSDPQPAGNGVEAHPIVATLPSPTDPSPVQHANPGNAVKQVQPVCEVGARPPESRRGESPTERDKTLVGMTLSTHPLAALGLNPEPTSQRVPHIEHAARAEAASGAPAKLPSARDTLLGLSQPEVLAAAATPTAERAEPPPRIEPTQVEAPRIEPTQVEAPRIEPPRVELAPVEPSHVEAPRIEPTRLEPPPIETTRLEAGEARSATVTRAEPSEVVPLAATLKSDPPPAPAAMNPQALMQPLLAAFGEDMHSKLGQELQARVLEMVAERVAAAVAKQMIDNLGQSLAPPSARPRPSRKPATKSQAPAPHDAAEPAKRSRKRAAKH